MKSLKTKMAKIESFNLSMFLFLLFILIPVHSFAGTKVVDYGFEDWSGWNGVQSPAVGWIFSQPAESYFYDNSDSTIVVGGGSSCDDNRPYNGQYYYHTQFNTSRTDPCLGRTASSLNHRMYIGYGGSYPTGTKDSAIFQEIVPSKTETLRFKFRVTGDWSSAQSGIDEGGGMKFIRQAIGRSYFSDSNNILVKLLNDGDSTYPKFGIYNYGSNSTTYYTPKVNWQDGEWHSFTMKAVNTGSLEYTVSIYLDDWEMAGSPLGVRVVTMGSSESDGFYSISLNGNWSAKYPSNLMGMDFDNFEVWDGTPDSDDSSSITIMPPHVNNPVTITN